MKNQQTSDPNPEKYYSAILQTNFAIDVPPSNKKIVSSAFI